MAEKDQRKPLRELYREGLGKCGFDLADVERGLTMLESGRYVGFGDVVSSLQIFGSSAGARAHQVRAVVQRVTAQEAGVAVAAQGARGAAGLAARRAEEAADRDDELRRAHRRIEELQALLREMTEAELDGRAPMRPHIELALRESAQYDGEFRVSPRAKRAGA